MSVFVSSVSVLVWAFALSGCSCVGEGLGSLRAVCREGKGTALVDIP